MKEKKKKKLAKLEKLEKQKSEDKPKKKKKEKKGKLTEKLPQDAVAEAVPQAADTSVQAEGPIKCSQPKAKGAAKHAQTLPADDTAAALLFRAMGDDVRLQIVQLIRENGELCAADLLKSVSIVQSTLSHHMKILCESGVVACRRQGKWSYYSIDAGKLEAAAAYLEMMAAAAKMAAEK